MFRLQTRRALERPDRRAPDAVSAVQTSGRRCFREEPNEGYRKATAGWWWPTEEVGRAVRTASPFMDTRRTQRAGQHAGAE